MKTTEGSAEIEYKEGKISKKLPVFYNPAMKENRDITILLLNAIKTPLMKIALPLAGSGVRAIRLMKELNEDKIDHMHVNDNSSEATKSIEKNLKLNNLNVKKMKKIKLLEIHTEDANLFLTRGMGYDYIDIDPFGSPIPFLDSAIRKLSRGGILAVTATDTSALCGTYTKVCQRKYWAIPKRNHLMHEIGLRILIRRVQLIGTQMEKALTPILSYSKDHYMRVFFICERSKEKCDAIIKQHNYFEEAGPMWLGKLQNEKLLKEIDQPFIELLRNELDIVGFHDLHDICSEHKLSPPKMDELFEKIRKTNPVSRTHFAKTGIKSTISEEKLLKLIHSS